MPDVLSELLFDRDEWNEIIAEVASPFLRQQLMAGGVAGNADAQALGLIGAFDVTNPQVGEWLSGYTMKFAQRINLFAADRFREIIGEGLEAGESGAEIAKRILDDPIVGQAATPYRAEMIARTEMSRANVAGQRQAWRESNDRAVENGLDPPFPACVWRANPDACDLCLAMDGTEVEIDGSFFTQGDSLTLESGASLSFTYEAVNGGDLHPNCRCEVAPVIGEAYRV